MCFDVFQFIYHVRGKVLDIFDRFFYQKIYIEILFFIAYFETPFRLHHPTLHHNPYLLQSLNFHRCNLQSIHRRIHPKNQLKLM